MHRVVAISLALLLPGTASAAICGGRVETFGPGEIERAADALRASGERIIALTFDDGPDGPHTAAVADALDAGGAKGTFFLIGNKIAKHAAQVRDLAGRGHELASHSCSHLRMDVMSAEARREELRCTEQALAHAGQSVAWFRPPYGNWTGAMQSEVGALGMRTALWDIDTLDWSRNATVDTVRDSAIHGMHPGAVILMHSINPRTPAALPAILEHGHAQGYTFVTMSQWAERAAAAECGTGAIALAHAAKGKRRGRAGLPPAAAVPPAEAAPHPYDPATYAGLGTGGLY